MLVDFIILFFLAALIVLYSLPRYHNFLPTIPIYDNKEVYKVKEISDSRHLLDIHFFELTDPSPAHAFTDIVDEKFNELNKIITLPHIYTIIAFFKYTINRPRPKQLDPSINIITSTTSFSPSYPSGHAFQAYYLAYKLSLKYPDKKELLYSKAQQCAEARVKGGHHYPSDGDFAKKLVGYIEYFNKKFNTSL